MLTVTPSLLMVRGAIVFGGQRSVRVIETISNLPGKKRQIDGVFYIQESAENMDYILSRHPGIEMDSYLRSKYAVDFDEPEQAVPAKYALVLEKYEYATKPFKHQLKDIVRFCDAEFYALFYEMGGGKTKVILDIAALKYLVGDIDSLLILAPKGVHRQWALEQIVKHLPTHIPKDIFVMDAGERARKRDNFDAVLASKNLAIFIVNDESLGSTSGQAVVQTIFKKRNKIKFVYDESSRIKNRTAVRSKFVHKMAPQAKCRAILNGTPVSQGAIDLFSQCLFLHPTILGSNFYSFRNRYCLMGGFQNRQVIGYRGLEDLQVKIDRYSSRVLKKDCLDLPPKMYEDHYVELTPEQTALYDSIKKEFVAQLENGEIVEVPHAAQRLMVLQGILSGWIKREGIYHRIPTFRTEVLSEILRQDERKAIIWIKYHEDVRIVQEHLRKNHNFEFLTFTGMQNDTEKKYAIDRFRNSEECRVLIASKAMDRGWDLVEGKQSIWYTPTYSLDSYEQSNDRIHRIGQESPVVVRRLTTGERVDHKNWMALLSKRNFATSLIDIRNSF
jgi:hypothetical protein